MSSIQLRSSNFSLNRTKCVSQDESNLNQTMENLKYMARRDVGLFEKLSNDIVGTFWGLRTQLSTSLDIISVYLKGQKLLYIEAKTYAESSLNMLMIPAICISAISSILSASDDTNRIIVAVIMGFNSFLLAMISYLKLDAKAETFRVTAYKFDKLQTKCEFYAGKVLYAPTDASAETLTHDLYSFIEAIEKEIHDIKEVNQFIIPQKIRYLYPKLYSINIFSEIKKLRNIECVYIQELNNIYCELYELDRDNLVNYSAEVHNKKKKGLEDKKRIIIKQIIAHRDRYLEIDEELTEEINDYIENRGCCNSCCKKIIVDDNAHKRNIHQIIADTLKTCDDKVTEIDKEYTKKYSEYITKRNRSLRNNNMGELMEYIPDNNEEHSIDISNQDELYDYTEEDTTPRSLLDEANEEGNDISSKELRIEIEKNDNNDVKNNYVGCIVM
jgi:hypothetical protein